MENGRLVLQAPTKDVLRAYVASGRDGGEWKRPGPIPDKSGAYFEALRVIGSGGRLAASVDVTTGCTIELDVLATDDLPRLQVNVRITDGEGTAIFTTAHTDVAGVLLPLARGRHRFRVRIPGNLLLPGEYSLLAGAIVPNVVAYDVVENQLTFRMEDVGSHATALRDGRQGIIGPRLAWEVSPSLDAAPSLDLEPVASLAAAATMRRA
jgi:lipopolysaccharide transport system ATP-binding protein